MKATLFAVLLALTFAGPVAGSTSTATWSGAGFPMNVQDGGTPTPTYGPLTLLTTTPALIVTREVTGASVTINFGHPYAGDVGIALLSPGGLVSFALFERVGATTAAGFGSAATFSGTYTFSDTAGGDLWAAAQAAGTGTIPPGNYRTSMAGGAGSTGAFTSLDAAFAGLTATEGSGVWTIRIGDCSTGNTGQVFSASLTVRFKNEPAADGGEDGGCSTDGTNSLPLLILLAIAACSALAWRNLRSL